MSINYKKPRYAIPIIILPFICLLFYSYNLNFGKLPGKTIRMDSLQSNIADVSDQVRNQSLSDKLEAYRNAYRQADGYTAIGDLLDETDSSARVRTLYNGRERQKLDSIEQAMKIKYNGSNENRFPDAMAFEKSESYTRDKDLTQVLAALEKQQNLSSYRNTAEPKTEPDPMELFRKQVELVDSMGKANDPEAKNQIKEKELNKTQVNIPPKLPVRKPTQGNSIFNTVSPNRKETFITAIIDQDIKGYAGSRLRIRLLEDLLVGKYLIRKGAYIFAQITGFNEQRVNLSIFSIRSDNRILPVKLDVYDNDGMPGLYIPASAFREFSKDLGDNVSQSISLQQSAQNNSQLVMSLLQKMFHSTSSAVSKMIRHNTAKLKYGTIVYLIDPDQLNNN